MKKVKFKFQKKNCKECGIEYIPTSGNSRYCYTGCHKENYYCQTCKKQDIILMKAALDLRGVQNYICRKCNTERCKKYRSTEVGTENINKAVARSMKKHREKQNARIRVRYAIKTGKIIKPKICSSCNEEKEVHGHHEDYSKPLDITWLCRSCHADRHREIKKITQQGH